MKQSSEAVQGIVLPYPGLQNLKWSTEIPVPTNCYVFRRKAFYTRSLRVGGINCSVCSLQDVKCNKTSVALNIVNLLRKRILAYFKASRIFWP